MTKHLFPILGLLCLIFFILTLVHSYSSNGEIESDGWGILVIIIGINMTYINYWRSFLNNK